MIHRTRDRLITQRTALINHIRGLLAEYGVVIPVGAFRFRNNIADAVASAALSRLAADMFTALIAEFQMLDTRIAELDRKLVDICRTNEQCRRLATLPGVGPVCPSSDNLRHMAV